jgi:outer membrane protein assembly factor BamB
LTTDSPDTPARLVAAYRAAVAVAVVAGALAIFVAGSLAGELARTEQYQAADTPEMVRLRREILARDAAEDVRQDYRKLDLAVRREYFAGIRRATLGGYLLVALAATCLAAVGVAGAISWRVRPASGVFDPRVEQRTVQRHSRWAVGATAAGLAVAGVLAAVGYDSVLAPRGADGGAAPAPPAEQAAPWPTDEEMRANWPRFRGPGGAGVVAFDSVPTRWDGQTGEGVAWKSPVPLAGQGSPVAWGGRVFLTGADRNTREVFCYDADDGELLWRREVKVAAGPVDVPKVGEDTGFAAATPATDGRRVYAIFANGDVVAIAFDGKQAWARNLGLPDSMYGYASSLAVYHGLLLVQYDQGYPDDDKSELLALDTATGKTAWRARRATAGSWASPIVAATPSGPQIITVADPAAIAYDPSDGAELWRAECINGDAAPSPAYAAGLVFAVNPNVGVTAIRTDGRGDVTTSRVAWEADDGAPDIASPACDGKLLWLIETYGLLKCRDAATGEKVYEHQFAGAFRSSPTVAGDRLFVMDARGVTYVVSAGRSFELLGTCPLGEPSNCSPAFQPGRAYIRGRDNLYCVTAEAK